MDPKDTNITKISRKIERIDLIYLGVIFLFLVITVVLFFYSTGFIVKNVNKIFTESKGEDVQGLDITRYLLVEKKLNLPVNSSDIKIPDTVQ
ncbi:MAG: hypothetical protein WAV23_00600 [Minisyncoccia bacterium]